MLSRSRQSVVFLILASVSAWSALSPAPTHAQGLTPTAEAPAETPPPQAPKVAPEFESPRAVLREFLRLMGEDQKKEAAKLLNLSDLNAETAATKGPQLAYSLYEVMARLVYSPAGEAWPPQTDAAFASVPNENDAPSPWKISNLDRYSRENEKTGQIEITRDDEGRWRFSKSTVAAIEKLFTETEKEAPKSRPSPEAKTTEPIQMQIRRLFPEELRSTVYLMPTYQWVCLLVIAVVSWAIDRLCRWTLSLVGDALLRRYDPDFDGSTRDVMRQVGRLAQMAIWYWGTKLVGLPLAVMNVVTVVLKIVLIIAALLALFALVNLVAGFLSRRAKREERKFDDLLIPIVKTTTKFLLTLGAIFSGLAAFDTGLPTYLVGGLGLGGLAIALASQETLSNFIGSLTVLFDRPFEVGDWIATEGAEGEIETVGFRSTRIRTGPNSLVVIPNSKLSSAVIDNLGRRKYRRLLTTMGVEYGTPPELIEAFCEGVREIIRRHPHTRKDFYCCYFNNFGASSLDIILVAFFEVPDWATELRERHRLLADIVRLASELGVEFAFPTQTLHMHRGEKPPAPESPADPDRTGQQLAAKIAGELPNYQDRPGRVKFTGPTPVDGIG